jgi:glycosyltransferase involved in cell wall biosynthesis
MKIVVGHHLWSRVGGGELVNAFVVKTLIEAKHEVAVVSTFGFDREKYKEWFDIELSKVKTYSLLPRMIPIFGIYQRLGFYKPLEKAINKERPDLVFVDNEIYKPILNLKKKKEFRLLEYIHFPFHAISLEKGNIPKEYKEAFERYLSDAIKYYRKYQNGLWKYYFSIWLKIYGKVARDDPFKSADVVLANSKYIARLINLLWSGKVLVLNPPVKIRDFEPFQEKTFEERENAIVMIGRISPEKRIEDVINALALMESKPTLKIIGGLIPSTIQYKMSLEKQAKDKNAKVEFHVNASREELVRIATSSKVFVHSTIGEHFGIAVVEGMAAGCPAIIHKSGGPYEDIIDYGKHGLFYETIEDLAETMDRLMTVPKFWQYYHLKSISRARTFSDLEFSKKLLSVILNE